MQRLISFLFLFIAPYAVTHAHPLLDGFSAEYDVIRNGLNLGVTKRQLVKRGSESLEFFSNTRAEGFVALLVSDVFTEHSVIQAGKEGIRPTQYAYQQNGGKTVKIFNASFDWDKQQLIRSTTKGTEPLAANTQDLLSFQLAIIVGLYQGQRNFDFTIVDHKRIQQHKLNYSGMETIATSQGKLNVVRLEHKNSRKNDRFTFWCAEKLHYLPIMIRKIEHDGDVVLLKLRKFNARPINLLDSQN